MRSVIFVILWSVGFVGCASRDNGGGQAFVPDSGLDSTVGPMEDGAVRELEAIRIDPACTDGLYEEALPNASADVSDLVASYSPGAVATFLIAALDRRYPIGAELTESGIAAAWFMQAYGTDCLTYFLGGQSATPEQAFGRLGTIVHECGHVFDIEKGMGTTGDYYQFTESLSFQCSNGAAQGRGGVTFARSLLNADAYSTLRPPCNGQQTGGCDSYADIYLDGNPDDAQFDSGDQGFSLLFEEAVQYVNSLAVAYAFEDQRDTRFSTSARDGILTFLWYLQRYLKQAREMFPDAYDAIVQDTCWRDAILTLWGRAWLFLDATKDSQGLTIEGPAIEALVMDEVLLQEIDRLRLASSCN